MSNTPLFDHSNSRAQTDPQTKASYQDNQLLPYLSQYSLELQSQVRTLILQDKLERYLTLKYPQKHQIKTNKALQQYVNAIKSECMRQAPPLHHVSFDSTINVKHNALGLNTAISRVQGHQFTAKKEIRIASLFKDSPPEFLRMIVVHELAHLKYRDHDKAFYKLCQHMEPNYVQFEFDLRVYLTWMDLKNKE